MNQFAAAAVAATLLAAACTASAWQHRESIRQEHPQQDAERSGHRKEFAHPGVGYPFPHAGNGNAEEGFGHNFYGWSYLYAFPGSGPRLAEQASATGDHR